MRAIGYESKAAKLVRAIEARWLYLSAPNSEAEDNANIRQSPRPNQIGML